ncbi:MAG: hypothetical protein HY020_13905 [Burkholderiales bacterium]|nr:hypothetical protein [Burkholderiales bacterium]
MTCEVAVANRLAIALAADSAVTFTEPGKTTYASGANKIFQLAGDAPVAVMINNSSSLGGVPWELIIKVYRGKLGKGTFPTLQGYWDNFLTFLNDPAHGLLPAALRDLNGKRAIGLAAVQVIKEVTAEDKTLCDAKTATATLAKNWTDGLAALVATYFAGTPVFNGLNPADQAPLLASHLAALTSSVETYLDDEWPHLKPHVQMADLLAAAAELAFKRPDVILASTGIVIAGFGEDDFLPGYISKEVFGFVGDPVAWRDDKVGTVDYSTKRSLIEAFAKAEMVETFSQGASPEVWKAVGKAFETHAAAVAEAACVAAGIATPNGAQIAAEVQARAAAFRSEWTNATLQAHYVPLLSSVASLNVEELAELAETLVLLESLKEKVTSRTQSVGGPIDVAVITKSEGLVWIKRKLYFDPALNQRYLNRLQRN